MLWTASGWQQVMAPRRKWGPTCWFFLQWGWQLNFYGYRYNHVPICIKLSRWILTPTLGTKSTSKWNRPRINLFQQLLKISGAGLFKQRAVSKRVPANMSFKLLMGLGRWRYPSEIGFNWTIYITARFHNFGHLMMQWRKHLQGPVHGSAKACRGIVGILLAP